MLSLLLSALSAHAAQQIGSVGSVEYFGFWCPDEAPQMQGFTNIAFAKDAAHALLNLRLRDPPEIGRDVLEICTFRSRPRSASRRAPEEPQPRRVAVPRLRSSQLFSPLAKIQEIKVMPRVAPAVVDGDGWFATLPIWRTIYEPAKDPAKKPNKKKKKELTDAQKEKRRQKQQRQLNWLIDLIANKIFLSIVAMLPEISAAFLDDVVLNARNEAAKLEGDEKAFVERVARLANALYDVLVELRAARAARGRRRAGRVGRRRRAAGCRALRQGGRCAR